MSNLLVVPFLLPMVVGAVLIFFAKHHRLQRIIAGLTGIALFVFSIYLTYRVYQSPEQMIHLEVGDWRAPFGIVLVGDMLSILMVLMASFVGLVCLFYGFKTIHIERERYYFYSFFFFLLTGVNGAFLTGDLFNLFVFFEVTLISSYVLISHGGKKFQLRESFKYVVMNMVASAFFLVAVAYLYAITGTLNMADLGDRVAMLDQQGIINVIAIIFLFVFGAKGALFPLYYWLPKSYYGPPAVITALFGALLTKVGLYSLIRTFTLIFNQNPAFTHTIILVLAGATMIFGVLGALSKFDIKSIIIYQIISQVGFMIMGLGVFSADAIAGSIYYITHDMVVKVALFFIAGIIIQLTGTADIRKMGGLLKKYPLLGWSFFIAAMSLVGIPPLSGFFGKFSLIVSSVGEGQYVIVGVALVVSLLNLFSMLRIFMNVFWGEETDITFALSNEQVNGLLRTVIPLIAVTIALGLGAEPAFQYVSAAADQLMNPTHYIDVILP
ncbi:Na(+)/H(+) antiporter subunit D [Paraliobacillus ryukyuensis]|uniref:Multisubunit sodium/proton antiporter MrpD subunit n=1 Tax=Paraliobacillus ryukyuensis TaxID=200904 RepID=A0A366DWY7_9BACI|nr:Na+/H+ antiporter subunit D [Paraliobacillus ryukyuensis]RBO94603.1 multisubunit sodium/proton antiporter MrpD subunit [Paraliobacillus ryukyuensis]